MVLDMARPKNKKSTFWPGMRGRDVAREVDFQGEHFAGIHDRFHSDPDYREAQLTIGWTEQKCKEWDEFAQKTMHTVSLILNKTGKNVPMKLRSDFRAAVLKKSRLHHESREQVKEPIHRSNTDDGILLQAHRGGSSLNGIGNEFVIFFDNRRGVWTDSFCT